MQITIEQADIDKANDEFVNEEVSICRSCVLFQALKRCGFNPTSIGYHDIQMRSGPKLRFPNKEQAYAITKLMFNEWQKALGLKVEIPDSWKTL